MMKKLLVAIVLVLVCVSVSLSAERVLTLVSNTTGTVNGTGKGVNASIKDFSVEIVSYQTDSVGGLSSYVSGTTVVRVDGSIAEDGLYAEVGTITCAAEKCIGFYADKPVMTIRAVISSATKTFTTTNVRALVLLP